MKHHLRSLGYLFLILMVGAPAFAANVAVGTCLPNKVSFDSLTDAIQGVPDGSTIQVCPGTYAEQLVISKSLTLKGISSGNAAYPVIVPPASGMVANAVGLSLSPFFSGTQLAAQIVVQGGASVTINGLALDAINSNVPACTPVVVGVLIQESSATLNNVAVKNQLVTGPPPCSATGNGAGVLAQNDTAVPQTIKVQDSTFVNTGQAFESDGANNTSTLTNNSFLSNPNTNFNAISLFEGTSTVQANFISNFNYPPAGTNTNAAAYGVYLDCVAGATVANNTVTNTQIGLYAYNGCVTASVSMTGNNISNASLIGIDAGGVNGLVQGNDIYSTQTAIRLPENASGNTIQNNKINDTCAAFGSNPLAGSNTILTNSIFNAQNLAIVNTTALCP